MNYIFKWIGEDETETTIEIWDRVWLNEIPELTRVNKNILEPSDVMRKPIMLYKSNYKKQRVFTQP
jgi:hypothetical protein